MSERHDIRQKRWAPVLAGGVVMGAALGVRHVQGLFLTPVTIDHGWSRETFGLALALQNLLWGVAQPFAGMIADRFGSARVVFAGMLVYALGLVVMAYAGTPGVYTLGTGVLVGVGLSGSAFGAVYGALSRIFPAAHRSWALGVAGAIGGLGQFCTVPFVQSLLSGIGWVSTLLVLASAMVLLAPLSAWLRDRQVDHAAQRGPVDGEASTQPMGAAIREALSHRGFWLLNAGFLACGFQLAFIAAHLPAYLLDKGLSARDASMALALIALANVIGTYLCGYVGDFMRRKYVLSAIYFIRSAAMAAFFFAPLSPASLYMFAFLLGLIWLGTVPLTSGVVAQVFGVRYIATLFGFVFFGHQLGSFLGIWLGALVYDATHAYDLLWYGAIGLGVIAGLLHLPIDDARAASRRAAALARPV